jgi:hypothetical protein
MGEAAGAAAVLSLHDEVSPRELDVKRLGKQLQSQGAFIDKQDVRHDVEIPDESSLPNAILRQQAR